MKSVVVSQEQGSALAPLRRRSRPRSAIDRLFTDSLHLSPLGEYSMALVSDASVYRRSPVGAWVPSGVTAEQANALQNLAWQSVSNYYNSESVPAAFQRVARCRTRSR